MREFAKAFYKSRAWKETSRAYMESKNYICERCGGAALICHHRKYLSPENIWNPAVSLDWNNLECLCQDCHNKEHFSSGAPDSFLLFDSKGNVSGVRESEDLKRYKKESSMVEQMITLLKRNEDHTGL